MPRAPVGPDNVGVIGVAVFREKVRYVPPPAPAVDRRYRVRAPKSPQDSAREGAAGKQPSEPVRLQRGFCGGERSERRDQQRLGTGHGRSEYAPTQHVDFERAQSTPDELITIHYDSRDNLIAMGAIPYRGVRHGIARRSRFPGRLASCRIRRAAGNPSLQRADVGRFVQALPASVRRHNAAR